MAARKKGNEMENEVVGIMGWLNSWPMWVNAVCGLVTAATAVSALTPSKVDDRILNTILKVLNVLAGNVMKNKNADG